jgi:hypothetical protein
MMRYLESTLYSWVRSWILPLPHPYFAVSDEAGEFQIENLPPGNWEFQVWHERTGNLGTPDWKSGRFTLEIKPGVKHLGFIKLDPNCSTNDASISARPTYPPARVFDQRLASFSVRPFGSGAPSPPWFNHDFGSFQPNIFRTCGTLSAGVIFFPSHVSCVRNQVAIKDNV